MSEQTKHDHIFLQVWMGKDAAWATKDRLHEDDVEYIRADLVEKQLANREKQIVELREALEYSLQAWHYDGISIEHGSTFQKASSILDAPTGDLSALREWGARLLESVKIPTHRMHETTDFSSGYVAGTKNYSEKIDEKIVMLRNRTWTPECLK